MGFWVGPYKKRKFKEALSLAMHYGSSTIVEKDSKLNIERIFDVELGKWLETEEEDFIATSDRIGRL